MPVPTIPAPGLPLAPPSPLPKPTPVGNPNEPFAAMLKAPLPSCAGTPLGSPKPPVWTCAAGFVVVGTSFVGVANVLVAVTLAVGAFGSNGSLLESSLISGGLTSGSGSTRFDMGAGNTILATVGVSMTGNFIGLILTVKRGLTGCASMTTGGS